MHVVPIDPFFMITIPVGIPYKLLTPHMGTQPSVTAHTPHEHTVTRNRSHPTWAHDYLNNNNNTILTKNSNKRSHPTWAHVISHTHAICYAPQQQQQQQQQQNNA